MQSKGAIRFVAICFVLACIWQLSFTLVSNIYSKKADKAASTEITQRQIEIKDYLRRYFTELTVEDLRPRNEEKRRIEIRNAINDDILSSSKIRDVRFLSLQIIEQ